jgi:diguanylate cyclase (GGDEF)-like protein
MKQFIQSKINIVSLIILTLLTIIVSFVYFQFDKNTEQIKKDILKNEIYKTSEYAQNITNMIKAHLKDNDLYEYLKKDKERRIHFEHKLSLFKSSKYIQIFIIRKDKKGKLRYLLDAEDDLEQRGFFNQKFDPQSKLWDKVFHSSIPEYAFQENIKDLWITYLYPIKVDRKTVAILAFDFSANEHTFVTNMINPIKSIFLYSSIILVIFLIYGYIQLYLYNKTEKKAFSDPLTSTYNRLYLNTLKNKINLNDYDLCIIDIDYFKKINDVYGHNTGDIVLQTFARRILNKIKKDDILIRFGGEEFLLIISKKDNKKAYFVPERIRKEIESEPIVVGKDMIYITASFGVNNKPQLSPTFNEAIEIADEQLYKAKNNGRNRVYTSHSYE